MQSTVVWNEGMRFTGTTEDGLHATFDAGESKAAASPVETLLMAAGACSMMDIVSILQKMRQDLRGIEVRMEGQRATAEPRILVAVAYRYILTGTALDRDAVQRAIELSISKYCSVGQTIERAGAKVTSTFEIREPG